MAERRRARSVKDADDDPDQIAADEAQDEDEEFAAGEDQRESGDVPASSRRRSGANGRQGVRQRPSSGRHTPLTVKDAARAALQQIVDLTAKPAETITGVERTEDGWRVGIEVIEDRRIPSSADILATYRAEMDQKGDLVSYHRVRRYPRGRGDSNEGS
jgi:Gas vesicle synthesis protein GvpO